MTLATYLDGLQERGRTYFSREEALQALRRTVPAFTAATARLIRKGSLISPIRGVYLILKPEDRVAGPDPARWIDPLMKYLHLDYRISLLRAAAFHGSSHQAAMVFQVIVPEQMRDIEIRRQRIQFVYQSPAAFAKVNRKEWLDQMKTDTGYAKVSGIELTLLDSMRYFHKAAGLNGAAQIASDLGRKANPQRLTMAAAFYENSVVRRLGYLLERFGHQRQANALLRYARKAKSMKLLNPAVQPLVKSKNARYKSDHKWMLIMNDIVEIDS